MRTVDLKWKNLAAGLGRVEKLEAELRDRWAPRIDEVRSSRFERARAAWYWRREAKQHQFEEDLAAWRAKQEELESQRRAWEQSQSHERQRLMDLARRGGLAGTVGLLLAIVGVIGYSLPIILLGLAAASFFGLQRLTDLRRKDPALVRPEDPEPQFTPDEPEPHPGQHNAVPLDIGRRWWREVAYDASAHAARSEPEYGDEGVEDFASYLMARLPDEYVALREVKVAKALDVDLLVLGPTGMWIFEVKYWNGDIVCHRGKWSKTRTWYEQGGYEVNKEEPIPNHRRPDAQWLREEHAVKSTLTRRVPTAGKLISTIGGGIVFTHPDAAWDIDDSCKSAYGDTQFWAETILSAPALLELRPEEQLRVLDALLKWAHTLDEDLGRTPTCSVKLAQGLFSKATAEARAYVEAPS